MAQDLKLGKTQPQETEQLHLRRSPFSEVVDMVLRGEITDAHFMIAVLKMSEWSRQDVLGF